jgi:hypothetical protein
LTLEEYYAIVPCLKRVFNLEQVSIVVEGMHLRTGTVVILLENIHLTAEKYDRLAFLEFLKNQNRLKSRLEFLHRMNGNWREQLTYLVVLPSASKCIVHLYSFAAWFPFSKQLFHT